MTRRCLNSPVAVALCSAGMIAFTAACGHSSKPAAMAGPAAKERAKIQRALDRLTPTEAPGAIALLRDGNRTIRMTSGYGNLETKTPIRATDRFRIGSVTKPFVATVVLQLVGEGKLSLDDTVERWLPGLVPNGKNITVRELLNHTSGLFDVTNDQGFIARLLWKRTEVWTPRKMVALLNHRRPGELLPRPAPRPPPPAPPPASDGNDRSRRCRSPRRRIRTGAVRDRAALRPGLGPRRHRLRLQDDHVLEQRRNPPDRRHGQRLAPLPRGRERLGASGRHRVLQWVTGFRGNPQQGRAHPHRPRQATSCGTTKPTASSSMCDLRSAGVTEMKHLWSTPRATSANRPQTDSVPKPQKRNGCHRLPLVAASINWCVGSTARRSFTNGTARRRGKRAL
jgi:Beta-lactamase